MLVNEDDEIAVSESYVERLRSFEETTVSQLKQLGEVTVAKTEWFKVPTNSSMTLVSKDVILFGSGCHLLLYDTVTEKEDVIMANSIETGDGVSCYIGNCCQMLFAFAEKRLNPRIFVRKYPSLENVCVLSDGSPEGYKCMSFAGCEYIITLSKEPYHNLIVWNWRTAKKVLVQPSGLEDQHQCIISNKLMPAKIAQLGFSKNKLTIWDVQPFFGKCILLKHEVVMPKNLKKSIDMCWSEDDCLFVLDHVGNVYQCCGSTYVLTRIIETLGIDLVKPTFTWYKGAIILVDGNKELKRYKRANNWEVDYKSGSRRFNALINVKDIVYGWYDGKLIEVDLEKDTFKCVKNLTSDFLDIAIILPLGKVFVTYSNCNDLQCWEIKTGQFLSSLNYEEKITALESNPCYPYVAVGLETGLLQFVSIVNPKQLKIFTSFALSRLPITKVRFNLRGNVIVTAHLLYGTFFVLSGIPGETIEIITCIDYRRTIIDYTITETKSKYAICMLVTQGKYFRCAKKIVVKMVFKNERNVKKRKFCAEKIESSSLDVLNSEEIFDSGTFYARKAEYYTGLSLYNNLMYAIPYQSRQIRVVNLEHRKIKIITEYASAHFLRAFSLSVNDCHVSTWGYDGLITLRTIDLKQILAIFNPHHRLDGGVAKSVTCPTLKYTISVGATGCLACTNLVDLQEDPRFYDCLQKYHEEQIHCFNYKTTGFHPNIYPSQILLKGFTGNTVIDYYKYQQRVEDEEASQEIRAELKAQFKELKAEVIQLLEANLSGPELEKIDILEFYLHKRMRHHKEALANFECEWTRRWSKQMIEAQNKVANWIKETYWDKMGLKRTKIEALFANFGVENYIKPLPKKGDDLQMERLMFRRKTEALLMKDDIISPWLPATDSFLEQHIAKAPAIHKQDERMLLIETLNEEEVEVDKELFLQKRKRAYGGSISHYFIEPCPTLYLPSEIHTFYQANLQMHLLMYNDINLRLEFNQSFDDLMSYKIREMQTIAEKNERLRYILSELNQDQIYIEDPKWQPPENPDNLTVVDPSEMSITPYISPSDQLILDAQAAEAERIRLLLLADDFRERALMEMMHGVLEIRWEDVIKRDIPKPKCMLEKEPENYTEDDIRTVLEYEKKVEFLMSERARYKNMLEAEYNKLSETVRESIKKFNTRLRTLLLLKIKIESARLGDELQVHRLQNWCQERIEHQNAEQEIIELIKINEQDVIATQKELSYLNEVFIDCKAYVDVLVAREKLIEKLFKRDISENTNLIQAHSTKLFKKNPRGNVKNITSSALLIELGRCLVSNERSAILTQECIDYMRSVDNLDQYIGVPNVIDEALYKVICRNRRSRLENELRCKANAIDQQDIENTTAFFQKRYTTKKELGNTLHSNLAKARAKTLAHQQNKQLAIIVQQGLVEIPLSGRESDFDNTAIVRREDVEEINEVILNAGQRKLKVMHDKMIHRRDILLKEWQHKQLSMEIEDLETQLEVVLSVKVTKEIQDYLRNKAKGYGPEKGMLTLDQEIEILRKSYERIILGRKFKVEELEQQIKEYQNKNKIMDQKISEINIDVCEQHLSRNLDFEKESEISSKRKMAAILKRGKLIKQIQDQHNEILVLQTELELVRLKTYPSLKFKTLD